jgi:hypothetical protein
MSYFKKVTEGDKVYGLVFGHGVIRTVLDGYYKFEVEFDNGHVVPYTEDGIPGWSNNLDFQTVFYKTDIDLEDLDFSPTDKVLSAKKIIKLRTKRNLEVRCPSGIWYPITKCPSYVTEQYLEEGKLHLFRKLQKKQK